MNIKLDRFINVCQPFSPIDACLEVLSFFEIQSKEKGLHIKHHIKDEASFIFNNLAGDRQRYQQILLNILQNSVKFTFQGGIDVTLDF